MYVWANKSLLDGYKTLTFLFIDSLDDDGIIFISVHIKLLRSTTIGFEI